MEQTTQTLIDTCKQWEALVFPICFLDDNDTGITKVPLYIAEAMDLSFDKTGLETVDVTVGDFRKALFEQGHIACLITLLTITNKDQFIQERNLLIRFLFEYVTTNFEIFSDWKRIGIIDKLLAGDMSFNTILPLFNIWNNLPTSKVECRCFQYILPIYLLLGNHLVPPNQLRILRALYATLVSSTIYSLASSYKDFVYDLTRSCFIFKRLVSETDKLFYLPRRVINVGKYKVSVTRVKTNSTSDIISQAGNWLCFGAYITLMSKFARYSLPIKNTKEIFLKEHTRYTGMLQTKLLQYNSKET